MTLPWTVAESLSPTLYAGVRQRAIFECFKWHTQSDGRPALCSFPLVLKASTWKQLTRFAGMLAQETLAAEQELRRRVELHSHLGLPAAVQNNLRDNQTKPTSSAANRVMRFDFHWTSNGWRISEANTDVAGGFIEASGITQLFAEQYPEFEMAGDPTLTLVEAARRLIRGTGVVGLMHMTVSSEDRQVMLFLERQLQEACLKTCLFGPAQLRWKDTRAMVDCAWYQGPIDFLIRFVPAQWLPSQLARSIHPNFFRDTETKQCNPGYGVLTQSKRFPLVWDRLLAPLLTWQALLPPTRAPQAAELNSEAWVLKPALGHEGHNIAIRGVNEQDDWTRICMRVASTPENWVQQQRFVVERLDTPEGAMFPCLGIYVIDGKVAGAYGRMAHRPLIDYRSRDVVVLVDPAA